MWSLLVHFNIWGVIWHRFPYQGHICPALGACGVSVEYAWAGMVQSPRASTNDRVMDEDAWHHPEGDQRTKSSPDPQTFTRLMKGPC